MNIDSKMDIPDKRVIELEKTIENTLGKNTTTTVTTTNRVSRTLFQKAANSGPWAKSACKLQTAFTPSKYCLRKRKKHSCS